MSLNPAPTGSLDIALAHASRLLASNPALAADQADEILKVVPNQPMALLLLGAAHTARGNADAAIGILGPLAQTQPDWAQAHFEFGIALGEAGRRDEALIALRRAVALKPDLPQAWRVLGDHFAGAGDRESANAAYTSHVTHSVKDPVLLKAAQALYENRIPEAEAQLHEHLKQAPTDVAAMRMLAEIAARMDRHEDAEQLLQRCLELAPSFHAARHNYALVLHRGNKPAEALSEIDTLLQTDASNAGCRNLKAAVLCRTGEYEAAIDIYAELLRQFPRDARVWLSNGHALKTAGHPERAIEAYRMALRQQPEFGEAYWSLANLKTFRFSDDELAFMQGQLQRHDLADEHRLHFEFAVGKALEDREQYAQSFEHYQQGNSLRRAQVPYNADKTSARVQRAKQLYTREFFHRRADTGSAAADPIFIVGLPRSGSTLIEQILSSHSAVEGTMELPEIISMTRALRRFGDASQPAPYHEALARMDAAELRDLGEQYIERTRIHRKSGKPFFIDKMPNNFAHIGLIRLALPRAKIIDARRHPLATCLSGFKQHFARGQDFSYNLDDIGRYYRDYVELMAHFDQVLPGRIHRVIYESLVGDTEAEIRRLLAYCGLPFEEECLRFYENDRPVRTASSEQVRQPIYRGGVNQWRHYEAWLTPLKSALGPVLDAYPAVPEFNVAEVENT